MGDRIKIVARDLTNKIWSELVMEYAGASDLVPELERMKETIQRCIEIEKLTEC